jgi:hypothetical protein
VPFRVAIEDLDDVARLAIEEMRDLLGAVLEGDGESLPVHIDRHNPGMIGVSGRRDGR